VCLLGVKNTISFPRDLCCRSSRIKKKCCLERRKCGEKEIELLPGVHCCCPGFGGDVVQLGAAAVVLYEL
jgi:hypothetical protein